MRVEVRDGIEGVNRLSCGQPYFSQFISITQEDFTRHIEELIEHCVCRY